MPSLNELLKQCIQQGLIHSLEPFIYSTDDFGVDFKSLFLFSCECKQAKIANELLAKEFDLNEDEISSIMNQLFGKKSNIALFEIVYQNAYGRLYGLLLNTKIQNPYSTSLRSIKTRSEQPRFRKTSLYLAPLKRAIKEKNLDLFNTLFKETNLPEELDQDIIKFLRDPMLSPPVIRIFEHKYTLKKLLTLSIELDEWATTANLLEHHRMNELEVPLQERIQKNSKNIVLTFISNLEKHFDQRDIRPRMVDLYIVDSNPTALALLSTPYHSLIKKTVEKIGLAMINKKNYLNGRIYHHSFDNKLFENTLKQLNIAFKECTAIIQNLHIDLNEPIFNNELIVVFAKIKALMAKNDITPYYLTDQEEELLYALAENPRFKHVCQLELKLYSFIKEFNLAEKSLCSQSKANQQEFKDRLSELQQTLTANKLPIAFVIPQIQDFLQEIVDLQARSYKGIKGIRNYLEHRDSTSGLFFRLLDYGRGRMRANHYLNLINQVQTTDELHVLYYAILVNPDGKQLKQDMAEALGFDSVDDAKTELKVLILTPYNEKKTMLLDQIINSINQKVNCNNASPTEKLLAKELDGLSRIFSTNTKLFFKQEDYQNNTGWYKWLISWFGRDHSDEDRLTPG